jgi:hypothetical protein
MVFIVVNVVNVVNGVNCVNCVNGVVNGVDFQLKRENFLRKLFFNKLLF